MTLSVFRADVGSVGGHSEPSDRMLKRVQWKVNDALQSGLLIDGLVTHTGDAIAITMSHEHGEDSERVHEFAWDCFLLATETAEADGLYGAGQDLLVDAPSGKLRAAGPTVAEIQLDRDLDHEHRPVEVFLTFAADKCSPGANNFPLYSTFSDPMHNRVCCSRLSSARASRATSWTCRL